MTDGAQGSSINIVRGGVQMGVLGTGMIMMGFVKMRMVVV